MMPTSSDEERLTLPGGTPLEMRRWQGTGTPILLLHEGLGSVAMWRDFPGRLADETGRPVIAWSRRGHGTSPPPPGPHEPDYMHWEARLIPSVLDQLGIERAILFGHSDGGSIALLAAAYFPRRVAGLILEAPHVFVEQVAVDAIAGTREKYLSSDLPERLARYHDRPDEMFWRWNDIWLDPRFRSWTIEEWLRDIRAPALLIQGTADEYGTLAQLDRIEAQLSMTKRLELDGCGHSPHRDRRDAVVAAVAAFVGELSP
ncbi:alpha/beta hydrolase [Sphingopyxis granuli]|uniref:alpha/beta fold hydrolase n=1 Tax=Sphingopyxis granuli TaxID=267128 RepID=UPI00301B6D45